MMKSEELARIVQVTIDICYSHWLRHGTPIKREDAPLVALDVERAIIAEAAESESDER